MRVEDLFEELSAGFGVTVGNGKTTDVNVGGIPRFSVSDNRGNGRLEKNAHAPILAVDFK